MDYNWSSFVYINSQEVQQNSIEVYMEINWVILGWLIDMLLNGFVWLVIAAIFLTLIDLTDTWTRKVLKLMDKADILLIILGILAQLEIIPKLIT